MVSRSPRNPDFNPTRSLLEDLSTRLPKRQFDTWFREARLAWMPPDRVVIAVRSRFHKDWLEVNYRETIRLAARSVLDREPQIEFELPESQRDERPVPSRGPAGDRGNPGRLPPASPLPVSSPLDGKLTFDRLVDGPSNALARAALLAVCDAPDGDELPYNPLVICGRSGLGKTHLLQACAQRLLAGRARRPLYVTCEQLVNHVLEALQKGTARSFLESLGAVDVLLVDDIQILGRTRRVQEEFSEFLDELHARGTQVILTSSSPPGAITGLSSRLAARLGAGLVARLGAPNLETRIRIAERLALDLGIELTPGMAELLARDAGANPRDLKAAVIQLRAPGDAVLDRLGHGPAGSDGGNGRSRRTSRSGAVGSAASPEIRVADIRRAVASMYKVKLCDMLSSCREHSLVLARQVGMFLARELTPHSLEEIGGFFGGRDHATVIYSVQKIKRLLPQDRRLRAEVDALRLDLTGRRRGGSS